MEKFYIENEFGQRYDFQNYTKVALRNPTGLGYNQKNDYLEVGNYFMLNSSKKNQKNLSIELEFFVNPFIDFFEFATFVKSYNEYKFVYVTVIGEFLIDIDIIEIPKKGPEKSTLITTLNMVSKSLWYKRIQKKYILEPVLGESRWDITWDFNFNDYPSTRLDITNNGQEKASFQFILYGYAKNPSLKIYKDNAIINSINFAIEILVNEKLLFSTKENDMYVLIEKADGTIINALSYLTLENNNFFKLEKGDSTLTFDADDPITKIDLVMFEDYEIV